MSKTIEQSLGTKKAVIISEKNFDFNGNTRKRICAKKGNGKKHYFVVQYENGLFSSAVTI